MITCEWSCFISFALGQLTSAEQEESEKFKMKIYISSGIPTHARHSTTGKSVLETARPRRLDDDLWFNNVLQDNGIQINNHYVTTRVKGEVRE